MPPRYIEHLTLATGDQRRSHRDEIDDHVIETLRPLLDRVAAGERVPLPHPAGYSMHGATGSDRALIVTVSVEMPGTPRPVPLVSIGVAPSSLASAELWRAMTGGERDDRTPRPPWCVAKILPTLALDREATTWLGDFERCVAWAWIDR